MPYGQIEIIDYRGVVGSNLYPRARPKARGILHVTYAVPSLDDWQARLDELRIEYEVQTGVELIHGAGPVLALSSPAGFRVELHARR